MSDIRLPSEKEFQLLALTTAERTGRDIAKLYKRAAGRSISYGTLYPTLRRLVDAGWVRSRDDVNEAGRIKWFLITGEGRRTLESAREHYERLSRFGACHGA